jgi:hypothetical protein
LQARLKGPTRQDRYVEAVKEMVRRDDGFQYFKPNLLRRKCIWREAGCYQVVSETEGESVRERSVLLKNRRQFRDDFLSMDFNNRDKLNL